MAVSQFLHKLVAHLLDMRGVAAEVLPNGGRCFRDITDVCAPQTGSQNVARCGGVEETQIDRTQSIEEIVVTSRLDRLESFGCREQQLRRPTCVIEHGREHVEKVLPHIPVWVLSTLVVLNRREQRLDFVEHQKKPDGSENRGDCSQGVEE